MSEKLKLSFAKFAAVSEGIVVVLADEALALGEHARAVLGEGATIIAKAAEVDGFNGKSGSSIDLIAPGTLDRLIVVGVGKTAELTAADWLKLGGIVMGKLPAKAEKATVVLDTSAGAPSAEEAAEFALGLMLRAYDFTAYKKPKDDEAKHQRVTLLVENDSAAKKAWKVAQGVAEGVILARDLVNEPPNVLTPKEFAKRAGELEKLGVEIETLDVKAMKKLGMNALLGVGQGSENESRLVIMRWKGGKDGEKPVAFVGKGVCFDSGGISIKPAASMEDMKGDMAGAACVTGLMHALASRKAKVNAVGAIGLVENMPSGSAQRPGDIVTSMSGQTIEIINTDAEGRLVLADVLWHIKKAEEPKFIVDLATLTGAILVALGQEYAGLFSNNDELSARLTAAGTATGERLWRLPLGAEYDKMIDSKFADMKNTGGRFAGSITAAQFLQRYIDGAPWAHLDIAGTGMGSPASDINKSWGSGFGVRLLDRLVRDHYED